MCAEQTDEIKQNKRRLCTNHEIINLNEKDYGGAYKPFLYREAGGREEWLVNEENG